MCLGETAQIKPVFNPSSARVGAPIHGRVGRSASLVVRGLGVPNSIISPWRLPAAQKVLLVGNHKSPNKFKVEDPSKQTPRPSDSFPSHPRQLWPRVQRAEAPRRCTRQVRRSPRSRIPPAAVPAGARRSLPAKPRKARTALPPTGRKKIKGTPC